MRNDEDELKVRQRDRDILFYIVRVVFFPEACTCAAMSELHHTKLSI